MSVPQKILDRIRQLLVMAEDTSSPNEAAIAARRAAKLLEEYQLAESEVLINTLDGDSVDEVMSDPKTVLYGTKTKMRSRPPAWVNITSVSVGCLFESGCTLSNGIFKFMGVAGDAQAAAMTFEYLVKTINRLGKEYEGSRGEKSAFRMGCASEIQQRCKAIQREREAKEAEEAKTAEPGTSLVVIKKALVEAHNPRAFATHNIKSNNPNAHAEYAGRQAGAKVSLNQQVGGAKVERIS